MVHLHRENAEHPWGPDKDKTLPYQLQGKRAYWKVLGSPRALGGRSCSPMALESQAPGALPLPSLLLSAGPPALPLSQFLRPRPPWLLSPAPAFVVSNLLISFLRENLLLTSPRLSFLI